ncbi:conserved hypothetical protein [Ricinus communis]|uniref:Uncharacterized protein n=1 Tax=Ricinus communis TaxID=3988 RepID=B9TG16_RICCO|nr:conserved hypothetical protein [Ricinus communis]
MLAQVVGNRIHHHDAAVTVMPVMNQLGQCQAQPQLIQHPRAQARQDILYGHHHLPRNLRNRLRTFARHTELFGRHQRTGIHMHSRQVNNLLRQTVIVTYALLQRTGHAVEFIADFTQLNLLKPRQTALIFPAFNLVQAMNNLFHRFKRRAYRPIDKQQHAQAEQADNRQQTRGVIPNLAQLKTRVRRNHQLANKAPVQNDILALGLIEHAGNIQQAHKPRGRFFTGMHQPCRAVGLTQTAGHIKKIHLQMADIGQLIQAK